MRPNVSGYVGLQYDLYTNRGVVLVEKWFWDGQTDRQNYSVNLEICWNGFQLSHSMSFNHVPIPIPIQAKYLFPFPLFSHIFPFPPIPILDYLTLNDYVVQQLQHMFHKTQHYCFSNTNSRHNFNTIHHCVIEDRNKSHYGPLCDSCKRRAKSVV